nr:MULTISPECIES: LysE family transporter [Viridibacillus]
MLGLTFTITSFVWCIFITYFSAFISRKIRDGERMGIYLNKITGIIFIGMGLKLLQTKAPQ